MDLRQLRYFAVLAEERHFGRAARRLSLSQPPLSHAIRQLEEELGAALFVRTSRQVALTPAGAALQREAQAILQRAAEARLLVSDVAAGRRGRLRIGFSGSTVYRGLPRIVTAMRAQAPDLEVILREMNSGEQVEALLHDELDAGFVHLRERPDGLDGTLFHAEPFVLCLAADHPMAAAGAGDARLIDLRDEDFILFSRSVSPDYYESIIALCRLAGFLPRVRHEVRHWLTVAALVAHGAGIALVPRSLAGAVAGIVCLPLPPSPIRSETWCVWKAGAPAPGVVETLLPQVRGGPVLP
ncbi:LysR family transcriptional regulator [Methylobacterium platani]|uniref:LysR family transcriptional regulator n=2 Tax=Methylobacterium platani TaxID=427683 RepID=A0A179RZQ5_9HYPH|nr:LysR family transcriptional regulator [Methylobacterium platani]KMO19922.1 LysR family transcriptional regulator [Methylobacterium platani JCM 14648]OAS18064.1 LysR family transcriptional regulator [Methylobacterium platani]